MFGLTVPLSTLLQGVQAGVIFGLLAVGLVLVYQSSRIINFAHAEIGLIAAALCELMVSRGGLSYWLAFPLALSVSAIVAIVCESVVIRRLRNAPRILSVVATLGLSQLVLFMTAALRGGATSNMPVPPWFPEFYVGPVFFNRAASAILMMGPLAVVGVWVMLNRSFAGRLIRASAANPEAAKLAGLSPTRAAAIAWGTAGVLSGLSAVLATGAFGAASGAISGPGLLVPAIAAAVLGRFRSMTVAFAAGIGLGVVQQVVAVNSTSGGMVQLVTFAIILVGLFLQSSTSAREHDSSSWMSVAVARVPEVVRRTRVAVLSVAGAAIVLLGATGSSETALNLSVIVAFAIVATSVFVLTGLAGQLSLGQFAVAGVGASVGTRAANSSGDLLVGLVVGGLTGAVVTILISLPGIRLRGLFSAVTTLSFAVVARDWLLPKTWMIGSGLNVDNPSIFGIDLLSNRARFLFVVLVFCVVGLGVSRIAGSGIGRRMRALRDNEPQARGFSVPALRTRLGAFGLAGFLAGVGGVVFGIALNGLNTASFSSSQSILVVAIAVIGGLRGVVGSVLGALYIVGLPSFVPLDDAGLAATALGWLVLVMLAPQGLAGLLDSILERFIGRRRPETQLATAPIDLAGAAGRFALQPASSAAVVSSRAAAGLVATGLTKAYGGVRAVDGVDFSVAPGETVSLIGANGAGKTTMFELLGGFTKADSGTVVLDGKDLGSQPPEQRAQKGVVRSFQDAQLFQTFTVREAIQVALEPKYPTRLIAALFFPKRSEAKQRQCADELIGLCGLQQYRDSTIATLSTGTRRITELACMIALEPRLLLLDEPSAGIAQRETEALATVIRTIKEQLDLTLVVVEHDIPFVRALSDRIVVMETGRVIANGHPDDVLSDPAVIESYLGNNQAAIARSGDLDAHTSSVDSVAVTTTSADTSAVAFPMRRRWASPTRAARTATRKRTVTRRNRQLGWATLPLLLAATVLTWADPRWNAPDWLATTTNNLFTGCLLFHAAGSLYLFGMPRPQARRQVVQVYLGYAVLLFTLLSQTLIGVEPVHSILVAPLWLLIASHVLVGARNAWLRRSRAVVAVAPSRAIGARGARSGTEVLSWPNRKSAVATTSVGSVPTSLRFPAVTVGFIGLVVALVGIVTTNRQLGLIKSGAAIMPALFTGIICIHMLFVWQWFLLRKPSGLRTAPFALLLLLGLITDNVMLALGNIVGEGSTLELLNRPRYWIHAILTPLGILMALEIGERCGLAWCSRHRTTWWIFTGALIVFGVVYDGFRQELVFTTSGGTTRYANEVLGGPPINAIATILVVITVAIMIWQRGYRANMFGFAFIMLVGSGVGALIPVLGNIAECSFVLSLLAGMQASGGHDRPVRPWRAVESTSVRIPWNFIAMALVLGIIGALHVGSNIAADHGPSPAIVAALTAALLFLTAAATQVTRSQSLPQSPQPQSLQPQSRQWKRALKYGDRSTIARRIAAVLFAVDALVLSLGNAVGRVNWLRQLQAGRIVLVSIAVALLALSFVDLIGRVQARPVLANYRLPVSVLIAGAGIIVAGAGSRSWVDHGRVLRSSSIGITTPGMIGVVLLSVIGITGGLSMLRRSDGWPASITLASCSTLALIGALWGGPNSPLVFLLACGALVGAAVAAEALVVRTEPIAAHSVSTVTA